MISSRVSGLKEFFVEMASGTDSDTGDIFDVTCDTSDTVSFTMVFTSVTVVVTSVALIVPSDISAVVSDISVTSDTLFITSDVSDDTSGTSDADSDISDAISEVSDVVSDTSGAICDASSSISTAFGASIISDLIISVTSDTLVNSDTFVTCVMTGISPVSSSMHMTSIGPKDSGLPAGLFLNGMSNSVFVISMEMLVVDVCLIGDVCHT